VRSTIATVNHAVNLADYMDDHDEEKKREQNITVRSGKYVDEVTNNRRLH